MAINNSLQAQQSVTSEGRVSSRNSGGKPSYRRAIALGLFWIGAVVAVGLAVLIGRSLVFNLRTLTMDELSSTIYAEGGPLYILWALSVTVGSILAGVGALVYVRSKPIFGWLTSIGVFIVVVAMVMFWTRVYYPVLFGIGGTVTLLSFFAIVWLWMKQYAGLDMPAKVAGSYKLMGYIFWINATWFMCGETGKLHLKAFEGSSVPSPIEIMVFLVLGWLFILVGEYKSRRLTY